ncbi:hypothetical protein Syun_027913 [Stephania yunnanensis]|uniref:Uncharacterized protein n=1 Tax=Stephania yunnanensis TaxID=152371 RepID=A0AAP0ELK6_9MAGN
MFMDHNQFDDQKEKAVKTKEVVKKVVQVKPEIKVSCEPLEIIGLFEEEEENFYLSNIYLPKKCEDPCIFNISYMLGDTHIEKSIFDLGASLDIISSSVFSSMHDHVWKHCNIIIHLAMDLQSD